MPLHIGAWPQLDPTCQAIPDLGFPNDVPDRPENSDADEIVPISSTKQSRDSDHS